MKFEKISNDKFAEFNNAIIENAHAVLGGSYVYTDGIGTHDGYEETGDHNAEDNYVSSANGTDLGDDDDG